MDGVHHWVWRQEYQARRRCRSGGVLEGGEEEGHGEGEDGGRGVHGDEGPYWTDGECVYETWRGRTREGERGVETGRKAKR